MTIEEKAKAYDEAFERARGKYAQFEGMLPGDVLEDVFPEIKDRVQPQSKQKWSEEDIKTIRQIFRIVKDSGCSNRCYDRIAKFLNNITPNPQKQWKPSDEQMDALETAVSSLQSTALESLYLNLKRL